MVDPSTIIASVAVGVPALAGTWFTARYSYRSKVAEVAQAREEERAVAEARQAEQRNAERLTFVQQLQAERDAAHERAEKKDAQIDDMWRDKAASREYVAQLRAQVWSRDDPPPVSPPAGYIE